LKYYAYVKDFSPYFLGARLNKLQDTECEKGKCDLLKGREFWYQFCYEKLSVKSEKHFSDIVPGNA